ncbi:MAG: mandelate racemase/muconate lactonizing enzyme family protein [Bdellovibrionales bacterium]|nr:mandelate racemase/muconate lactonizing enzyme family protein [Bdellovibrionales bacterium]
MHRRAFTFSAAGALLGAARAAGRISKFEILSARVPFHERVRDAWLESWKYQKRDQQDYVLTFVRLLTDTGLTGIAEAKMPRAQAEAKLKAMVGRPVAEFEQDDSLRGILIAVYDVLAQAAGVSIAKYLSRSALEKVIPTWWSQCFPPAVMASEAKLGASLGYRVHKVKARPWQDPVAQAAAICAVVPKNFKVWVDANSSWQTVERTIDVTRELAKFPNYFAIESPIDRRNFDGYRALKGKLPLKLAEHVDPAVASGELDLWIKESLLDAWIVGAPKIGPYTHSLASRAKAASRPIWIEHSIDTGISQVFQAHQAAAFPSIQYVIAVTHVLADDCMREPFTVRDGYYHLPGKPGLGVSLDLDAIERYRMA